MFLNKKEKVYSNNKYEYLIVGLGNPGTQYENTRHNVGFLALDKIANKNNFKINKIKYKGLIAECNISSHNCVFLKPGTFMNASGEAVVAAANFYKIPVENIIVIFDDISLDVGELRIRRKGSDGGHNGIKNIIYLLGKDNFPRIKIGVGKKPNPNYDLASFVLSSFKKEEMEKINGALCVCEDIIKLIMDDNIDKAMNLYNNRSVE